MVEAKSQGFEEPQKIVNKPLLAQMLKMLGIQTTGDSTLDIIMVEETLKALGDTETLDLFHSHILVRLSVEQGKNSGCLDSLSIRVLGSLASSKA